MLTVSGSSFRPHRDISISGSEGHRWALDCFSSFCLMPRFFWVTETFFPASSFARMVIPEAAAWALVPTRPALCPYCGIVVSGIDCFGVVRMSIRLACSFLDSVHRTWVVLLVVTLDIVLAPAIRAVLTPTEASQWPSATISRSKLSMSFLQPSLLCISKKLLYKIYQQKSFKSVNVHRYLWLVLWPSSPNQQGCLPCWPESWLSFETEGS